MKFIYLFDTGGGEQESLQGNKLEKCLGAKNSTYFGMTLGISNPSKQLILSPIYRQGK